LTDRVALITGAGAGVGREIALRMAADKTASVIAVNDIKPDAAADAVEELSRAGATAVACPADVTDWDAVQDMVGRVGPISILVNNAGVPGGFLPTPFAQSVPSDWAPWLSLNLYGVMYCSRSVLPGMLEAGWGRVVTVISDAARVGEAGLTPYATGKAAAAGFTRSIAREVGSRGITCNCVALGTIKHGFIADFLNEEREQQMLKRYIVKRLGRPSDAAGLISFLCSDDGEWITGQTYPVNGGFSLAI
jgi:3-oxoacyl-[acyl-carrier protein] reductase